MNEPPNPEVAVFAAALELPADQRGAYLDQACAGDAALRRQVEALLQDHDDAGSFFDRLSSVARPASAEGTVAGSSSTIRLSENPAGKTGDRIGRYKLLQQIGEGGCGVVYVADPEEPVRPRVALKVIKLGMDTQSVIARFEAERQAASEEANRMRPNCSPGRRGMPLALVWFADSHGSARCGANGERLRFPVDFA